MDSTDNENEKPDLRAIIVKPYFWYTLLASIGGFIFGFDTGSIGPITVMPAFRVTFGHLSPMTHGLLVSSILLPAALSSVFSGYLADRISRTFTISFGGALFAVGALVSAVTPSSSLSQLFVGRVICGLGEGVFLSSTTVYALEIAPTTVRGTIASIFQLLVGTGLMVGYFVCFGCLKLQGQVSWRLPFILQTLFSCVLTVSVPWLPHSPVWLDLRHRSAEAEKSRMRLGLQQSVLASLPANPKPSALSQIHAAWSRPYRPATLLALFSAAVQQLAGVDGVLYYAPLLFSRAGLRSSTASFLASGLTGIVNMVVTLGALILMDRIPRRKILLVGGVAMAAPMTIIGALYSLPLSPSSRAAQYTTITLIFVYFAAFCASWGIVIRIYIGEAQPARTRSAVSAQAQATNWIANYVVALSTPVLIEGAGGGVYFAWAAAAWTAVGVWWAWMPETRGVEMDDVESVKVKWGAWRKQMEEVVEEEGSSNGRASAAGEEKEYV